ncbi:TetR/AcrR family transcriptional regulator [Nocardia colli]|uniref:TetR/AcrR family transcriptional regulator n=2 Tax=Nocardia colli TaxID=2545717 RepID=A0A5N0EPI6_9NOCA|nr:TetR/AcrR family transcriptional regulator [Nocardia colli]
MYRVKMPTTEQPTRRERLRTMTTTEITTIALRQMAADGPGAISLRGIAREMGMTARAIYSYFADRDDLITALIGDLSTALADALETARDAVPADDPGARLLAWCTALREWALTNPEGFRLIYGDPVPGYSAPDGAPVELAAQRICSGLNELVAALRAPEPGVPVDDSAWPNFPPDYLTKIRADTLTPETAELALRVWGRVHGQVSLEIHGHLRPVYADPAALFHADLLELVASLGATHR